MWGHTGVLRGGIRSGLVGLSRLGSSSGVRRGRHFGAKSERGDGSGGAFGTEGSTEVEEGLA